MTLRLAITFAFAAGLTAAAEIPEARLRAFMPLPKTMESADNPSSKAKVELGRLLYFENRISKGHDLSCNSCHMLDKFGVDNEPTSDGHKGQKGDRNSPTVYNAALHLAQFWDGRAKDVEEQAKGPVLNPVEMAMPSEKAVVDVLKSMPEYEQLFRKAFPGVADPITYDNMAKAIGAFERLLVTPSRWDKYLNGDKSALTDAEKNGFMVFSKVGCVSCHNGTLVGGTSYQKLGVAKPWPHAKDAGRFAVTKAEQDKMVFKVPSLRNIEKTWPYMHDGGTKNLEEAITKMGDYQLGGNVSKSDAASIAIWLKSLTGEPPADLIAKPKLPPSTAKTPKPNTTE
jgi:cytochrome c peroxidase